MMEGDIGLYMNIFFLNIRYNLKNMKTLKDASIYNNMEINKNMKGLKDMSTYKKAYHSADYISFPLGSLGPLWNL